MTEEKQKKINKKNKENKLTLIILSILLSLIFFLIFATEENYKFGKANESKYLIEDVNIEFRYDEENYEVASVINNPYVIVSGPSEKVNLLKLKKGYKFYVNLEGAQPGEYNLTVLHEGIDSDLTVEIYPFVVNVLLKEKEVISYEPIIELEGIDKLKERGLMVGLPEIIGETKKVKIRETLENFGKIGSVKGKVNVGDLKGKTELTVALRVYDKEGKELQNINLIDTEVLVRIPIEEKVIIEEVINQIVVEEKIVEEKVVVNDNTDKLELLEREKNNLEILLVEKEKEIKNLKDFNESSKKEMEELKLKIIQLENEMEKLKESNTEESENK